MYNISSIHTNILVYHNDKAHFHILSPIKFPDTSTSVNRLEVHHGASHQPLNVWDPHRLSTHNRYLYLLHTLGIFENVLRAQNFDWFSKEGNINYT